MDAVANIQEARKYFAAASETNQPYDVVISDQTANSHAGRATLATIQNGAGCATRVIVTSSAPIPAEFAANSPKECRGFAKPIWRKTLWECLACTLKSCMPTDETLAKESQAAQSLKILLAEDNAVNQKLAIGLLERMGHQVVLAVNGLEAVRMVQDAEYDIVLMDLQMPSMCGLEAATKIRELGRGKGRRTPIVAMTAHAAAQDEKRCLEAGMDGYLTKPVRAEGMRLEIERVIMKNQLEKEKIQANDPDSAEEIWNLHELLERLDNDHSFLSELLTVFRQDSQDDLQDAKTKLAAGDLPGLERTAHTLKGMMRNLLMNRAALTASHLEIAARQEQAEEAAALLLRLEKDLRELLQEVNVQMAEVKT